MTTQLTAAQLQQVDPRRFEHEHAKWAEWQWEDAWVTDSVRTRYAEQYAPAGVSINTLNYSVSYSQGDYASFDGRVHLYEWMEAVRVCPDGPTYAERYPALYLACREDGTYMDVWGEGGRRGWRADWHERWTGISPCGVFSGMPEEDWDELVSEQDREADLEAEVLAYCKSIGREMYNTLSDYWLDATSKEAFIEACDANEVTFEMEVEDEIHCESV